MKNDYASMFENLRQVDWTKEPDTVETKLGRQKCWYQTDDYGRRCVVIELTTPDDFFADLEGDVWGGLVGVRYYPEELAS